MTLKRTTISAYQVGERLARSIYLSGISLVFAIAIAIPLGVYQAVKRNTIGDNIATSLAFVTYSMPVFFLGLILSRSSPCPGPSRPRSASGASCPADQPAVRLPVPHPVPVRAGLCAEQEPELRSFGPGHVAACHFPLQTPDPGATASAAAAPARAEPGA